MQLQSYLSPEVSNIRYSFVGYDPRDFALVVFGGAGPLAANAVGKLLGAWPVIVPCSPGILCAHGDATTRLSHELSSSYIQLLSQTTSETLQAQFKPLEEDCKRIMRESLATDSGIPLKTSYEIDLRYKGQVCIPPHKILGLINRFVGNHPDHRIDRTSTSREHG